MSGIGAAPRAAASDPGAPRRAATAASHARAAASRRNGAKSRGPTTPEGKARAALNALKHGMRAEKHALLPQEDAAEFAALEGALLAELAPAGALQLVLARRIVIAAWRLARADRLEAEVLAFQSYAGADPGLALIRDGNATRSIDTLLRYRNAAVAELTRTLRTLQALQAAPRANAGPAGASRAAARVARRAAPDEPARGAAHRLDGIVPDPPDPAATLHEPAVPPRRADQTETGPGRGAGAIGATVPNEPERRGNPGRSARATHARATPGGAPRSGAPGLAVGPAPAAGAAHAGAPAPRARIEPAARQDGVAAPPGRPPAARRRCAEPAG